MKKILILLIFIANFGIGQSFQFNDISLKSANKWGRETNRSIFIYLHSKFNIESQKIESEILKSQEVRDILYNKFICIKLDILSEDGAEFIKKYNLADNISVVFMDNNDHILHKDSRSLRVDEFIELTENTLLLATENDPLKFYENEFANKKNDKEFLEKYLNYLIDKRLDCTIVISQYFRVLNEEERIENKNLVYLVNANYKSPVDSELYNFIAKIKDQNTLFKSQLLQKFRRSIYQTIDFASQNKNKALFLKSDSLVRKWESPTAQKYEGYLRYCQFYSSMQEIAILKPFMLDFIEKEVWADSDTFLEIQNSGRNVPRDSLITITLNENYESGSNLMFISNKMTKYLTINLLSSSAKIVLASFRNDPEMLQKGLLWIKRAEDLSLNDDSHDTHYFRFLYLNNQKENAIEEYEKYLGRIKKFVKEGDSWLEFNVNQLEKMKKGEY